MNKSKKSAAQLPVVVSQSVSQIDKLIEMALDKNLELDRLEKLLAMKKEHDAEVARKAYYGALSEFQFRVPKIIKNINVNYKHRDGDGTTDYDYADLDRISDSIKIPMHNVGLTKSWDQEENDKEGRVSVVCIITHIGGHQERSKPLSGPFDTSGKKGPIHSKASTISYLRRYTLTGMLGLTSAESDDDGRRGDKVNGKKKEEAVTGKIKLSDPQLATAVKQILAGEKTLEAIEKKVDLEPAQRTVLEMSQKQADEKKPK